MNRTKLILTVSLIALIMVCAVPTVDAHSLEWGLSLTERFDYTADGESKFDFYITVNHLPDIPTTILARDLPTVGVETRYSESDIVCEEYMVDWFGLPFNDWDFITEYFLDIERLEWYSWDLTISQNTTHWSVKAIRSEYWGEVFHEWDEISTVLKENGILVFSSIIILLDGEVDKDVQVTLKSSTSPTSSITTTDSTTPIPPDNDQTVLFQILAIAGVAVVLVLVIAKKRPSSSSKVSPDARVLIICPYCGSKTEQGITKCQKCGAEL